MLRLGSLCTRLLFPRRRVLLGLLAVAALVAGRGQHLYWIVALAAVVAYVSYESLRTVQSRIALERQRQIEASDVRLAIIEALVLAIDAEQPMAALHLRRLKTCAEQLARGSGLPDREVQAITTAALLRDIGNLAVPGHVLGKQTALTAAEFEKVKIHPRVGAEILAAVPFPVPVAPLILAHHEHWDGSGYPHHLHAEAIPLGARILAVAEVFTALLEDQPHQAGVDTDRAFATVGEQAGRTLDPSVVATLVALRPALDTELAALTVPAARSDSRRTAHEEIAAAHREAEALHDIAQALGSTMGVFDTMMLIWLNLQKLLPVSCCALFLWSEHRARYECRFAAGENESSVRRRATSQLGRLGDPVEPTGSLLTPETWRVHLQSGLVTALTLNEQTLGALVIYHTEPDAYTAEHRRLLGRVAQQAALVLRASLVFDRTRDDSLRDALTGIPNRRALEQHLERETTRAARRRNDLALLVCDLEGFKSINDRYGHDIGDRALAAVGRALHDALAPDEFCARFAGDEFVVVLPGATAEVAARRKARLQRAVAALRLSTPTGHLPPLGISVGIAACPTDGISAAQLFAAADQRMYDDKVTRRGSLTVG